MCFVALSVSTAQFLLKLKACSFDIWRRRFQLFCHNQGIYLNEYMQVAKY